MNEAQGFLTLGNSNWTICSLLRWFCSKKFPPFCFSYWEVQFLITPERGRKEGASTEYGEKGITQKYLGVFELDHLQPVELILFEIFHHFYFILGGLSVSDRRERTVPSLLNGQSLLLYHYRSNFLLPQREEGMKEQALKMGKRESPKSEWHRGFWPLGCETGPFAACWADFVPTYFHPFAFHTSTGLCRKKGLLS